MTEPLDVSIQAALLAHLTTPALSGSPPIAYPFVTYTPISDTAYLDARAVLRAEPSHLGIAFTAATMRRGIFQVDAVAPENRGEAPGLRLAALVAARFSIGTKLVAGSYRLLLDKEPTIAAAVMDAPWVRFPVSIPYVIIT